VSETGDATGFRQQLSTTSCWRSQWTILCTFKREMPVSREISVTN